MKKKIPQLHFLEEPNNELFRTIRSNIRYSLINGDLTSLLVTSTLPGEGKTTIAVNIAVAIAETGKKVLLVDGNLRNPTVHLAFDLPNRSGLSSLLVERVELENVINPVPSLPGLYVLPSGPVSPNPAELLGSESMKTIFAEMKEKFDTIILDSSPLLVPFSDAVMIAGLAEKALLVIKSGKVLKKNASAAKGILERQGASLIGAVLNYKKGRDKAIAFRQSS